jgi:hypothetical protein
MAAVLSACLRTTSDRGSLRLGSLQICRVIGESVRRHSVEQLRDHVRLSDLEARPRRPGIRVPGHRMTKPGVDRLATELRNLPSRPD